MHRRQFLTHATSGAVGFMAVGPHAWAARGDAAGASSKRLVVVFLRGAVDGLSVVVPYADADYARWRPTIAVAKPGAEEGALDLDGQFGLHPALAPLMPYWQAGQLAFVHAAGSSVVTRSHFDAQDDMESGTPGRKSTADGWMNRLLGELQRLPPHQRSATQAVSVGAVMPRIFSGHNTVANIPSGLATTRPSALDQAPVGRAFDKLYSADDPLAASYRASREAREEIQASLHNPMLQEEMMRANNGAPLPDGFAKDAGKLATLMRNDAHVQLGFMALGGWDTHANQGNGTGQLAKRLAPLGQGLAAMAQQLGPVFKDTVIVVMSEFGRTVRENGNRGTDHGHGNVMWVLGGAVAGAKVHGPWPGLQAKALYEGRDLAVTTDFRSVLSEVLTHHVSLPAVALARVFPNQTFNSKGALGLIRA
jgi:uncharacterized protein (DUF1501 family)